MSFKVLTSLRHLYSLQAGKRAVYSTGMGGPLLWVKGFRSIWGFKVSWCIDSDILAVKSHFFPISFKKLWHFGIRAISEILPLYISPTFRRKYRLSLGFSGGSVVKYPPAKARNLDWIPGSGRCPGVANGNPRQYSCLKIPRTAEPLQAIVYQVAKSWTWLSDWACTCRLSLSRYL